MAPRIDKAIRSDGDAPFLGPQRGLATQGQRCWCRWAPFDWVGISVNEERRLTNHGPKAVVTSTGNNAVQSCNDCVGTPKSCSVRNAHANTRLCWWFNPLIQFFHPHVGTTCVAPALPIFLVGLGFTPPRLFFFMLYCFELAWELAMVIFWKGLRGSSRSSFLQVWTSWYIARHLDHATIATKQAWINWSYAELGEHQNNFLYAALQPEAVGGDTCQSQREAEAQIELEVWCVFDVTSCSSSRCQIGMFIDMYIYQCPDSLGLKNNWRILYIDHMYIHI